MPRTHSLPADASPLWRWMHEHKITVAELAERLLVTPNYLGDVRRGLHRPSDDLKVAIGKHTLAIEKKLGVKNPRGVTPADWFTPTKKRA